MVRGVVINRQIYYFLFVSFSSLCDFICELHSIFVLVSITLKANSNQSNLNDSHIYCGDAKRLSLHSI